MLLGARLVDIVAGTDGGVRGVVVERPDGAREKLGCGALILASGGFAANRDMVAAYMPEAAAARHYGHEGNGATASSSASVSAQPLAIWVAIRAMPC